MLINKVFNILIPNLNKKLTHCRYCLSQFRNVKMKNKVFSWYCSLYRDPFLSGFNLSKHSKLKSPLISVLKCIKNILFIFSQIAISDNLFISNVQIFKENDANLGRYWYQHNRSHMTGWPTKIDLTIIIRACWYISVFYRLFKSWIFKNILKIYLLNLNWFCW